MRSFHLHQNGGIGVFDDSIHAFLNDEATELAQ
jgi:hypothetical protein